MTTPVFDFSDTVVVELAALNAARALHEDVGAGDLTASLIGPERRARAHVLAREVAVICGAPWVPATLQQCVPAIQFDWQVAEGQLCALAQVMLTLAGSPRALLTAERTRLNF
jgi:nicotinate-nucleotide pyrophosphorylase (carboxylating)